MPYKREGTTVYVQKKGLWRPLKTHPTVRQAEKHLVALRVNAHPEKKR